MSLGNIKEQFELKRFEDNYIENVLRERLKVDTYHVLLYKDQEFSNKAEILAHLGKDEMSVEDLREYKKKYKTKRYSYPTWGRVNAEAGKSEIRRVDVNCVGRPYVFQMADFLTAKEIEELHVDEETKALNDVNNAGEIPLPF
jgi:DNA repair exonuclease SbcCD ATPase subunit